MARKFLSQLDEELYNFLHDHIYYCEEFKDWYWKKSPTRETGIDDVVGYKAESGYISVRVLGKLYYLHRLVWFMHNAAWPDNCIDHIDGDRGNNCIDNLRDVTQAENNANRRADHNNLNGHRGVTFVRKNKTNPWQVRIVHKNSVVLYEKFSSYELAVEAAQKVYESLGLRYE